VLTTLRTAQEVRSLDDILRPDLPKPDAAMLQIVKKIVEQQSGDFDPSPCTALRPPAPRAGPGRVRFPVRAPFLCALMPSHF
jgi:hypothetical protein